MVITIVTQGRFTNTRAHARTETGREVRSLRTRPDIRPRQRARIFARDNGTCVICHRHGPYLVVAHLISVCDGLKLGLSDADLFSDDNLAAMCEECNAGFGKDSLPPWDHGGHDQGATAPRRISGRRRPGR